MVLNVTAVSQIEEQTGRHVYTGVCGRHRPPLGGVLSVWETPERLHGLENVTTASADMWGEEKMGEIFIWVELPL